LDRGHTASTEARTTAENATSVIANAASFIVASTPARFDIALQSIRLAQTGLLGIVDAQTGKADAALTNITFAVDDASTVDI
jgi:hypothetical protein